MGPHGGEKMSRVFRALEKAEEEKKRKGKGEPSIKVLEERPLLEKGRASPQISREKKGGMGTSLKRRHPGSSGSAPFFCGRRISETEDSNFSSFTEPSAHRSDYQCLAPGGKNDRGGEFSDDDLTGNSKESHPH